jgi:hypothetical protein
MSEHKASHRNIWSKRDRIQYTKAHKIGLTSDSMVPETKRFNSVDRPLRSRDLDRTEHTKHLGRTRISFSIRFDTSKQV